MNNETILKQLNWRYAVKKMDPSKKISDSDWNTLAESLRLAPSSYGLQPWKFFVVQNLGLRKQLREASWNQSQVEDCSHMVVFATRPDLSEADIQKYIDQMVKIRGVTPESLDGYKNAMIGDLIKGPRHETIKWWAQRQSYIAMGFLMQTAALLNIDTCPLEGLDPAAYDRILGLQKAGYATVAAVACGYRHADDKYQSAKKVRFDSKDVIEILN
jgi:nitroreductase